MMNKEEFWKFIREHEILTQDMDGGILYLEDNKISVRYFLGVVHCALWTPRPPTSDLIVHDPIGYEIIVYDPVTCDVKFWACKDSFP